MVFAAAGSFSGRAKLGVAAPIYLAVLLEGVMLSAPGPTLGSLASLTGSTLADIGILFTANGLGFVVGALAGGRLFARVAGTRLLAAGLMLMAAASFAVPSVGSIWHVVALFTVIGFSIGMIDVGGNTLFFWLYEDAVAPHMNTLHLFWGIGAFATPLLVAQVAVSTGQPAASYRLFSIAMVAVAAWLIFTASPEIPTDATPTANREIMRRHRTVIGLMGLLFFIHVGAELAFGGWVFSYATAVEIGPETTARVLNSLFWGGLVLGRLIAIPLSTRLSPGRMIRLDLIGAAVSLGIVAFLPGWALWVGTALFGMSIASLLASCLNYAGAHMTVTSQVTSVFLVGASLGSMTLPWLVGRLFVPVGPEAMVYVVAAAIVAGLVVFGMIGSRVTGRRTGHAEPVAR